MDSSYNPQGEPPAQYQVEGQGYQPPPPPPPAKAKGFNWLACCGITCLVLIIVGGLVGYGCFRMIQPMANMGIKMGMLMETVSTTDLATIKGAAVETTPDALYATPAAFEGQWLAIQGVVGTDVPASASTYGAQADMDATSYALEGNVILMDVTNVPHAAKVGDTVRGYGKAFVWDLAELGKMPFVGKFIAEDIKNDPNLAGQTKMIFFISKGVEVVSEGSAGDAGEADEPAGESEGWIDK